MNGGIIREVEHKKEGKNSLKKTTYCFFHLVLSLPRYELKDHMKLALQYAERAFQLGEVPVGAVIVNADGNVIATAHNLVESELMPPHMLNALF